MNWSHLKEMAQTRYPDITGSTTATIHVAGADPAAVELLVQCAASEIGPSGGRVRIAGAGSFGYYELEPIAAVRNGVGPALLYAHMDCAALAVLAREAASAQPISAQALSADLPLFGLQQRIVLRNCGLLDPEDLLAYVALARGFSGLADALKMSPQQVIERIAVADLRGRGGAGFPAAEKWRACRQAESAEKIIVCNALDSDPQARTSRLLLSGDPCSVLEGLLIGAYAVGASRCIVCVDRQEEAALQRLDRTLTRMREYGLLGDNILETGFRAEIEVKPLAAALVAGEQTALLRTLQGRQAMPYVRTGRSTRKGLEDLPTLVQNIETLAHVTAVFQDAGDHSNGVAKTKIVTVADSSGSRVTTEVPLGTPLRRIVEAACGEKGRAAAVKAVQLGGPSGAYLAGTGLDTTLDFESLAQSGAFMGSGTIEILAVGACAAAAARDATVYLQTQSCGKCVFCREGSLQLADILERIVACTAQARDLDSIQELGEQMKSGCICGLGRTAAIPAMSSLALFRGEYEAHIKEKRCLADSQNS